MTTNGSTDKCKAIIVRMPYETDLHNVIQVARAEGMKLYKNPERALMGSIRP